MTRPLIVFSTFEKREDARDVVRQLVDERLVACGTMIPGAESIYRWKGEIEESSEVVVIFKTVEEQLKGLRERLIELHPYEVPEVVAVSPREVAPAYLEWLRESCADVEGE